MCWNVHHSIHMYMCLSICMYANVCACARSSTSCLLFVYLTVRFVCGGLISICLSASTHTFVYENGYTHTHCHTRQERTPDNLILLQDRQAGSRKQKICWTGRSCQIDGTKQSRKVQENYVCLSFAHNIRARVCTRLVCLLLWIIVIVVVCSSLTGWDLWQIAKLVKARKNWVHTNKQKHALSQNSRIKAVWAKVTTWSSFMYKKNVAPGFVVDVCVCESVCLYDFQ